MRPRRPKVGDTAQRAARSSALPPATATPDGWTSPARNFEEAVGLVGEMQDPGVQSIRCNGLGTVEDPAWPDRAKLRRVQKARALARKAGDREDRVWPTWVPACINTGSMADARAAAREIGNRQLEDKDVQPRPAVSVGGKAAEALEHLEGGVGYLDLGDAPPGVYGPVWEWFTTASPVSTRPAIEAALGHRAHRAIDIVRASF